MLSENLLTLILNYINFNRHSKYLDLQLYNIDYSINDRITFEDYRIFISNAIGIHLSEFENNYIDKLTHIQKLNISKCNIEILPKELFTNGQFRSINCSHNRITVIPKNIGKLINLQKFYCNDNQVAVIPAEIGNCKNLKKFHCYCNQLTVIPAEIENCKKLKIFYYNNNKITIKNLKIKIT